MISKSCIVCESLQASEKPTNLLQRDVVIILNTRREVCYIYPRPEVVNTPDICGRDMLDYAAPEDRDHMRRKLQPVFDLGHTARWLVYDVWYSSLWSTFCEPLWAKDGRRFALLTSKPICPRVLQLSPSQRMVLMCLSRGMRADQIAQQLQLSPNTVRTHLKRARIALECADLQVLLRWSILNQQGLELSEYRPRLSDAARVDFRTCAGKVQEVSNSPASGL